MSLYLLLGITQAILLLLSSLRECKLVTAQSPVTLGSTCWSRRQALEGSWPTILQIFLISLKMSGRL